MRYNATSPAVEGQWLDLRVNIIVGDMAVVVVIVVDMVTVLS